ncbi:ATP-binding protein [Streptomyces sp. NBC_00102]|uniref:ATP-binding protein n=1 Tax=Streptomyces sp. NBC_00102 TaxID=2975652 RepID=UPI0022529942|nr:ATP-binding protein [Streptomyces sp. NBC_00102]MCX5399957.1 ATP-binding protein [Streptomyces sp. NBC_00102]
MTKNCTKESPAGLSSYSKTLPRTPASAAVARQLVRTALVEWGIDDLNDDATLVVTELTSNSIDHGHPGPVRVTVSRPRPGYVRIGVVDRSKAIPSMRPGPYENETRGRGLVLVDALSERWGIELYRWGKQVWAELSIEVHR